MELNPARAGMAGGPGECALWSFRVRVGETHCSWLDRAPGFETIPTGDEQGADAYAASINSAISDGEWQLIRCAVSRGQSTGGERFIEEIQKITGRRLEYKGRGRRLKQPEK